MFVLSSSNIYQCTIEKYISLLEGPQDFNAHICYFHSLIFYEISSIVYIINKFFLPHLYMLLLKDFSQNFLTIVHLFNQNLKTG